MGRVRVRAGADGEAEWPIRGAPLRITRDDIARAARALVAAYGPAASQLMLKRTRAVRRRGDSESAVLWSAVAQAVEEQLGLGRSGLGERDGGRGPAD